MEAGAAAGFRRTQVSLTDPDEVRDLLGRMYGARLLVGADWDASRPVTLTAVSAGGLTASAASCPADRRFRVDGRAPVMITTVVDGTVSVDRARTTDRYRPGDTYLANYPGADCLTCHTHHARTRVVTLPSCLLADAAGLPACESPGPVTFTSFSPVEGGARRWSDAVQFVSRLLADPTVAAAPLLIASGARLLAATALSVFPNTAVAEAAGHPGGDTRPGTVRRAAAFIEANADRAVTVTEIAAAAGVTPRALQLAFRRHLNTTPLAYLRRIRLELAHRDLSSAVPGAHTTVTAVALRWGFASKSRFAREYRAAYGQLPDSTLRG
jgi:AraC-like DNA-binding protein